MPYVGNMNTTFTTLTSSDANVTDDLTVTDDASVGGDLTVTGSLKNSSGDLTVDIVGDIVLDSDGGAIRFKDAGTAIGVFRNSSSTLQIEAAVSDADMKFNGSDGGSGITALTLDMSAAGAATFNNVVITGSASLLGGADRYGVNVNTGDLACSSNAATALYVNRENDDGDLVRLSQDRNTEGNISVSGSTVSYNAFTGSHWSRLSDNSKPTILRGTVLETIDEMCDWYQAEYTIPATTKKDLNDNTIIDAPETTGKDSIALPSGKKVGDTITHTKDGVDYTAKIIKEKDIKHVKCKISDTADSSSVYGVFMAWDNDDDTVNDMYVNALGTAVIRIHKDITVAKGDLVVSNGDGTAKKQDDDIIRSKTIGKVLANIKQETYSDGSYTVPCALYCG